MSTRRLRGALVGFGFIAEQGHLPAYRALAAGRARAGQESGPLEIVAVADVSPARRLAAARALPDARIYDDYRALLANEASELDFVDVTAPPYVHAAVASAALESGLHVLCEKPLTTRASDARALVALAARQKRVLFPGHNYKHAPVVRHVAQILASGVLGAIHDVTLQTFRATHARGVPEWNEHWRRDKALAGGGIAMDHGSHTLYLAFDWLGAYPTALTAKMRTSQGPVLGATGTDDTAWITMTFPTGTATAHLTWRAGVRKVIYTLHGAHGAIRVEDDDVEVAVLDAPVGPGGKATWTKKRESVASKWMDASHAEWFVSLFTQFHEAILRGEHVGKEARDAVACIEVIEAAYASAEDGSRERPVVLPF